MLGYRDVIEISQFQQVGVDNRETETNHNDEAPMFDEEKEDQEIREKNEDNEFKFSSYFTSKFSCANLSSCVSFFSSCLIQQTGALPLSFLKNNSFFLTQDAIQLLLKGITQV